MIIPLYKSDNCIQVLETLLEDAKEGKISAVCVATAGEQPSYSYADIGGHEETLNYYLDCLKMQLFTPDED